LVEAGAAAGRRTEAEGGEETAEAGAEALGTAGLESNVAVDERMSSVAREAAEGGGVCVVP
jgi:hypothetical protein